MGCPDSPDRPDRPALHYVLFALPTFTSRRIAQRDLRRECDGFFVALAPAMLAQATLAILSAHGGDLRRSPRQQSREPRPVLGAVHFGVTDLRQRAGGEQGAQIDGARFRLYGVALDQFSQRVLSWRESIAMEASLCV